MSYTFKHMLPWEVLCIICDFCPLCARYVFSQTCTYFRDVDWKRFAPVYRLRTCTKAELKDLILREFSTNWTIRNRNGFVWNAHLNRPLRVWSPWSSKWGLVASSTSITFSNWRFLEFVRHLGHTMTLKTPCIGYARGHEKVVRVYVSSSARIKAHLIKKSNKRQQRHVWQHLFKKTQTRKVRALLAFRIDSTDCLRVHVKGLEFVTSR